MAERMATCWCEEHMVRIPIEWIGVRTRTCGNRECRSPTFAETPRVQTDMTERKITARAQCGTMDGYLWHIAHAAEACRPCRIAWGCASERETP